MAKSNYPHKQRNGGSNRGALIALLVLLIIAAAVFLLRSCTDGKTPDLAPGGIVYDPGAVEGGWEITSFLYTRESVYESALRLYELEDSLAGLDFLRISRSAIVNFRCIRSIRPELGGRLLMTMENGEQVYVSRQNAVSIKEKLRELERSFGR